MLTEKDRVKLASAKGLRLRVDMYCKECIYDPQDRGTWRAQVERCEMKDCPLWPVRPGRMK